MSYRRVFGFAAGALGIAGVTCVPKKIQNEELKQNVGVISVEELSKHNKPDDLWVSINGNVYDLSGFCQIHPGGVDKIMRYAGKDCSKGFRMQHPIEYVDRYVSEMKVGKCERIKRVKQVEVVKNVEMVEMGEEFKIPLLKDVFSVDDFRYVYSRVYGWKNVVGVNKMALSRIFFRPRCLVDVSEIDMGITVFGEKLDTPFVTNLRELRGVKVVNTINDVSKVDRTDGVHIILDDRQGLVDLSSYKELGVDGIVLREKDGFMSPIETLVRAGKLDIAVFVEEGISRGTDIVKVLCLGGIPLVETTMNVFSSLYGTAGVEKCQGILEKEVETTMKLIGAPNVKVLDCNFLDLSSIKECFNIDYKRYKDDEERYTALIFPKFGASVVKLV